MASAPSTVASPSWRRRTWAEARWPATSAGRWLLRLALALPFLGLAFYAWGKGFAHPLNRTLVEDAAAVVAGGAGLAGLDHAYPPLPTLIAGIVPGGTLGVSLVAAVATGLLFAAIGERLVRREVPRPLRAALVIPLVLVPATLFAGSQNLVAMLTLTFLALALEGFVRFAFLGETEGGFVAGLYLGCAFLCGPVAVVYALCLGLAAPFLAGDRFRAEPSAVPATWAVLMFPTVAALGGWAFLEWRFTGVAFGTIDTDPDAFSFPAGGLTDSLGEVALAVAHTPLYVLLGVLFAIRRPLALVGYLVPVLGLFLTHFFGLTYSQVAAYVLLTLIALVCVPRRPGPRVGMLLATVAVAQWFLAVRWPPTSPAFEEWLLVVWNR